MVGAIVGVCDGSSGDFEVVDGNSVCVTAQAEIIHVKVRRKSNLLIAFPPQENRPHLRSGNMTRYIDSRFNESYDVFHILHLLGMGFNRNNRPQPEGQPAEKKNPRPSEAGEEL